MVSRHKSSANRSLSSSLPPLPPPSSKKKKTLAEPVESTNLALGAKRPQNGLGHKQADEQQDKNATSEGVKVSDIIGGFGPYQIAVVIFSALRALCCAMDALSGPFLSPNIKHFQCDSCDISSTDVAGAQNKLVAMHNNSISGAFPNGTCSLYLGDTIKTRYDLNPDQCHFDNVDALRPDRIRCNKWSFDSPENDWLKNSLTIEYSLVCDREWFRSLSNSMYFVGATFGLLFWGVISDRFGRKTAYVCSHLVSMTFGLLALFANSMTSFILLRAISSFGMIGELIPRSIQVEIVATEFRFVCSVVCQVGWATGIILIPTLAYFNQSYKFLLSIPIVISFLMLPWLIWLPESARWLVTNQQYEKARRELRRAAKINGKLTNDTDNKIEQFSRQVLRDEMGSSNGHKRTGIWRSILAIFTNAHLLRDTLSVFLLLFIAEVVYFSLTLNVADLGGSLYINYIISGLSELVSISCCGVLLANLSRRVCLSLLLLASTVSYLLLALVNVYEESLSMTIVLSVNAFGKLTAIGNLMVIILVSQEVFPTVIRQFGTSLCITIGKAGSAVAPFTHELGQIIGQSYCFAMFSFVCLACAIVPFLLSETGNRELPDTVVDVEEGAERARKKKSSKQAAAAAANYSAHYESNKSVTSLKLVPSEDSVDCNNNSNKLADTKLGGINFYADSYCYNGSGTKEPNNNNMEGYHIDRNNNRDFGTEPGGGGIVSNGVGQNNSCPSDKSNRKEGEG